MEEDNEEQKEPFNVDNVEVNLNEKKKTIPLPLIGGILLFLILLLIALILINSSDDSSQKEKGKEISKKILGEINCIFKIDKIDYKTEIIGKEFKKQSDFSIIIDEERQETFDKEYLFKGIGEHQVKIELYEEINMDYMFKGIKNLKSAVMVNSTSDINILSMIGTFENCELLDTFIIKGFNTKNVRSLNKLFYHTSLCNLKLDIDLSNVEDASFMLSKTYLEEISLLDFNMNNLKNMSYMFYSSNSLRLVKLTGMSKKVEDMSHIFDSCQLLNEIDLYGINTRNVKNMSGMFKDCISLSIIYEIENIDTTYVNDMSYMFKGCSLLDSLDLKKI
jgi:hypothetical protein